MGNKHRVIAAATRKLLSVAVSDASGHFDTVVATSAIALNNAKTSMTSAA